MGDTEKKIGVQVTSRTDSKKIIDTYEKIYSEKNATEGMLIGEIFERQILFVILSLEDKVQLRKTTVDKIEILSKGNFKQKNIIYIKDLIRDIISLFDENNAKFQEIYTVISMNIETLPEIKNDAEVVEDILSCFNRPAFTVEFRDECNLADFEIALKNTISLINTGRDLDNNIKKYNVNDIASKEIKKKFLEVVDGINKLRKIFCDMQTRGYATRCKCGKVECKLIFNNDFEFSWLMNDLRTIILHYVWDISKIAGCDFSLVPSYCPEKLSNDIYKNDSKGNLCKDMDYLYEYHNSQMNR